MCVFRKMDRDPADVFCSFLWAPLWSRFVLVLRAWGPHLSPERLRGIVMSPPPTTSYIYSYFSTGSWSLIWASEKRLTFRACLFSTCGCFCWVEFSPCFDSLRLLEATKQECPHTVLLHGGCCCLVFSKHCKPGCICAPPSLFPSFVFVLLRLKSA